MFLYNFVRPAATLAFKYFFRKIHITGNEYFPHGKPVIFAGNHPTGFLDPCVWACFVDEPLHFLVRGDLFNKPWAARIMKALHMIPIFRKKDGFNSLKRNDQTFEYCYKSFAENKTVLIFSEGKCTMEKRLQPLQKGTARLAFGVWDTHPGLDIYVVLAGINYTYPERLGGSEVMCEIAKPIRVLDYEAIWKENPNAAYTALTEDIRKGLSDLLVVIDDPEDEVLAEHLLQIHRNNIQKQERSIVIRNNHQLGIERNVCMQLNALTQPDKAALKDQTTSYFDTLQALGVDDKAVAQPIQVGWTTQARIYLEYLPYALGYVGHYVPIKFSQKIAKEKVKFIEFYASVFWAAAIGSNLVWYIFLAALVAILGSWVGFVFLLLLPIWGFQAIQYTYFRERFNMGRRIANIPTDTLQSLKNQRRDIMSALSA